MAAYTDFTFTMFRGDSRTIAVAALQPDGVSVQNITGWTLWFTAKMAILDADVAAIFQKKTGGLGITITSPTGGLASIALAPADTDGTMATGTATSVDLFCDLQGKDGSGNVATLATGKLTVLAEITRTTT
jgi:hypothetical protein